MEYVEQNLHKGEKIKLVGKLHWIKFLNKATRSITEMIKSYKIIILSSLLLFITGCSDAKIDTTTEETTKSSIQKVKDSLSADNKEEFDKSIDIFISDYMKKFIHGKTGLEVISLAHELKAHPELKEYKSNKSNLAQFKVISSTFKQELSSQYSSIMEPIIELRVKNETEFPISRAYFKGTIQSEGRSIPWLVENFNYIISGGIEPQEESIWILSPNMFSDWGRIDIPKDAIFTVQVEKLDGADGKELFSIKNFSDEGKKLFDELEKKSN